MMFRLIVGLGNPGSLYTKNRHNIGYRAVDRLHQAYAFPPWREKFKGRVSQQLINTTKVMLLCPTTFMNLSGQSLQKILAFYQLPLRDIIVIHDDIDLHPGTIKIKQGGGHGGHNGLRNIDACVGKDYWRLRIGVGRPENKEDVGQYVLNNFSKQEEETWIAAFLDHFASFFPTFLEGDMITFISHMAHVCEV